jgi:hypothetical protein
VNNRITGTFRDYWLRKKFGIGEEDYQILFDKQDGKCAICGSDSPRGRKNGKGGEVKNFFVDHCHETGKVRGLLCNHCNRGLGLLGDNLLTLKSAVSYLENQ